MRRYIRHPSDIPIEYYDVHADKPFAHRDNMANVSLGGVSFLSAESVEVGKIIMFKIPLIHPPFEAHAKVVWCSKHGEYFEVGVELLERDDAYRARMIEQVCHIEHYKREVLEREGRELSGAEAAAEWIEKFAADFPNIDQMEAR